MICQLCHEEHDDRNCSKVIGINRSLFSLEWKRTPIPIPCECKNCGNKWRDVAYGVVKNSIYTYDFCSKCYDSNNPPPEAA